MLVLGGLVLIVVVGLIATAIATSATGEHHVEAAPESFPSTSSGGSSTTLAPPTQPVPLTGTPGDPLPFEPAPTATVALTDDLGAPTLIETGSPRSGDLYLLAGAQAGAPRRRLIARDARSVPFRTYPAGRTPDLHVGAPDDPAPADLPIEGDRAIVAWTTPRERGTDPRDDHVTIASFPLAGGAPTTLFDGEGDVEALRHDRDLYLLVRTGSPQHGTETCFHGTTTSRFRKVLAGTTCGFSDGVVWAKRSTSGGQRFEAATDRGKPLGHVDVSATDEVQPLGSLALVVRPGAATVLRLRDGSKVGRIEQAMGILDRTDHVALVAAGEVGSVTTFRASSDGTIERVGYGNTVEGAVAGSQAVLAVTNGPTTTVNLAGRTGNPYVRAAHLRMMVERGPGDGLLIWQEGTGAVWFGSVPFGVDRMGTIPGMGHPYRAYLDGRHKVAYLVVDNDEGDRETYRLADGKVTTIDPAMAEWEVAQFAPYEVATDHQQNTAVVVVGPTKLRQIEVGGPVMGLVGDDDTITYTMVTDFDSDAGETLEVHQYDLRTGQLRVVVRDAKVVARALDWPGAQRRDGVQTEAVSLPRFGDP